MSRSGSRRRVVAAEGVELDVRVLAGDDGFGPFLLVHGLASNARMWDGMGDALDRLGHPSVAVDLRGHGQSDKPAHGYDFETIVEDLCRVMDVIGLERPVAVGQSLGGNVVVELAALHPERVRGIACVDGGWIELADRFEEWEECAGALAPPDTEGTSRAELERRYRSDHPDWPEAGIQAVLSNYEVRPDGTVTPRLTMERHMRLLEELWRHRPSRRWAALRVPVLLVPRQGDEPHGWERAIKAAEAAIPRSRTHWMRGDHDLHTQHPDQLAALLHRCVTDGFFR